MSCSRKSQHLESLSHRTLLAKRRQCDEDTIRYDKIVPPTLDVIHSDDMHCFSINMSSVEEGAFVVWWVTRRLEKVATEGSSGFVLTSTKIMNSALLL
jgi:hypothetical protein